MTVRWLRRRLGCTYSVVVSVSVLLVYLLVLTKNAGLPSLSFDTKLIIRVPMLYRTM